MDAQLAEIYGTNQSDDDIEKIAAADMLLKLAAENDVDLSQLSDSDVAEMLEEIQKTAAGSESSESSDSPESREEKVAEADYLGRVMAHSMNQELREIQKEAAKMPISGPAAQRAAEAMGLASKGGQSWGKADRAMAWLKDRPNAWRRAGKELANKPGKPVTRAEASAAGLRGRALESAISSTGKSSRLHALGRAAKEVAPELAAIGTVGAGGGAYALHKNSSVDLEEIAAHRAYEMAKQAGWVDRDGDFINPGVKEASAEDLIDRRALELLEENGYPVQWNQ